MLKNEELMTNIILDTSGIWAPVAAAMSSSELPSWSSSSLNVLRRAVGEDQTTPAYANAIAQALTEPSGMEVFAYLREAAGCGEWLDEVVESSYRLLGALGPVYFSAMTEASYRMALGIPASVPGSADMLYVCTLLKQKDYAFSYIAARHG